jgi:hypothetical protein
MAKNIKNFVNREFAKTVDLDLLKRLLDPFSAKITLDWNALPAAEKDKREAIFEFFRSADERLPAELLDALHKIMVLSDVNGARLLQEQAELADVSLVPKDEIEGENDGRHLTPRHLALRAYLEQRPVFERTLDIHAFWAVRSPLELSGDREGVESRHEDEKARIAFAAAASAYFASRYLGRYCDVRWYPEADEINILVLHGKNAMTANVEENGAERTLTYREIAQDTIRYDVSSGRVKVSANTAAERKKLVELFAEHLIGDADFFEGEDAQRLYTLEPIRLQGEAFRFAHSWDPEVVSIKVKEIQVDEGEHEVDGRTRYSPWAMTVRDSRNAVARLVELAPDVDFQDIRINFVKLEFHFNVEGKETRILVKVKPHNVASFRDHSFEDRIMEHLERNGIRIARGSMPTAAAAE